MIYAIENYVKLSDSIHIPIIDSNYQIHIHVIHLQMSYSIHIPMIDPSHHGFFPMASQQGLGQPAPPPGDDAHPGIEARATGFWGRKNPSLEEK